MKLNVWVAGAIVAVVIVCFIAVAALTMASQGPKSTSSGVCSVNGYVVDTLGEGIPGTEVTLHVIGQNGDKEFYNMTAHTQSTAPNVGLFDFDDVTITPDAQYAYLSTSVEKNTLTYYGRTNNFSMQDNASIHQSIVLRMPPANATMVNGTVVSSYGIGIPNITVTLHMTGSAGQDNASEDLSNVSTISGSGESAGAFTFYAVPVPGTLSGYVSAEIHPTDNMTIYGRSNNFAFDNGSVFSSYIVLHVPPEYLNATMNST